MRGGAPCKSEPAVDVLEGDDIPSAAMNEPFDGIECHAVARISSFEILGFTQYLAAVYLLRPSEVIDLLREDSESPQIVDESSHGRCGRNGLLIPPTEPFQQYLQLLFAKVRMLHPESLDLIQDFQGPDTQSSMLRRS